MTSIRIGNAAGFWGDNLDAPRLLAERTDLDYLTLEYLAELTMSILAHLKSRDPEAGFVTDVPTVIQSLVPSLSANDRLKIVTNGGGMNPTGCAKKTAAILNDHGLAKTQLAAVDGDDLLPRIDQLRNAGEEFHNFETGKPLGDLRERVVCANAYLGASGIVEALDAGARIVLTGRIADASLVVGPAIHEFGWSCDDWTKLGAATVAGHLIECGAQVTGGMYSEWTPAIDLADVGYPIAEIDAQAGIVITKPTGTGGVVNIGTVAEQLVYEIGDPEHYFTPDVDADFSRVTLTSIGEDRVAVANADGGEKPERYKVSLAYRDGYMVSGSLTITGPRALEKSEACVEIIRRRLQRAGCEPERMAAEHLGSGAVVPCSPKVADPPEVVLRIVARDPSKEKLERFTREFAPLVTSGPPGVTGYTGPRQKPWPVMAYWPTTIGREHVTPRVQVQTAEEWLR